MKKNIFLFLTLLISCNIALSQKKYPPEKPKLVIGIVVEQMRYDYIQRYWNKFQPNGIKRLINEGTLCKNANYNYLFTQSSPGYATIVTGTNPSQHGIVGDKWFDKLKDKVIVACEDNDMKTIGNTGNAGKRSAQHLITSNMADELRLQNFKQSKVFSVSLKDNGALISAGHIANGAYWFDDISGSWISSSYFMDELPAWVNDFNAKKFPDTYLSRQWTTLLPLPDYTESLPDNNSYEAGFGFSNTSFPYDLVSLKQKFGNYTLLKYTPFGNTFTKDMAIHTIMNENLGKGKFTDMITIGFSSTGYVSDIFGVRSVEIEDTYLRLDQDIVHLLQFIDEYIGKENVLVYLTSDYGASDFPQFLQDVKMTGGTFNTQNAIVVLESYLGALYGQGNWVKNCFNHQLYLNQFLIENSKLKIEEVQLRVAQFMVQFTGVSNALTASTIQTTNFTSGIFEKVQNSYNQERSGDVIINLAPGWVEKNDDTRSGITQSSAYSYNTHVPLIWYGWKVERATINRKIDITSIAPTITNILDIAQPNGCDSPPILEIVE